MVQPEHQAELYRWVEAFVALDIPLIVKFHGQSERENLLAVLRKMTELEPFGVHVNVRHAQAQRPDVDLVGAVKRVYPGSLLVSGYVRSAADARALFDAGADMVGIAAPVMKDPGYIQRIATAFHL
jgi:tRNA-dihydrouridine synthase